MIILHCTKKKIWDKYKDKDEYGQEDIEKYGFIHCSTIEYFWRVASHFNELEADYVILCIETDKVKAEMKWEDSDNNPGWYYSHIYGTINRDSIIDVLPYLRDNEGKYVKNPEFYKYEDK